jgi:hypothetical protein
MVIHFVLDDVDMDSGLDAVETLFPARTRRRLRTILWVKAAGSNRLFCVAPAASKQ